MHILLAVIAAFSEVVQGRDNRGTHPKLRYPRAKFFNHTRKLVPWDDLVLCRMFTFVVVNVGTTKTSG